MDFQMRYCSLPYNFSECHIRDVFPVWTFYTKYLEVFVFPKIKMKILILVYTFITLFKKWEMCLKLVIV